MSAIVGHEVTKTYRVGVGRARVREMIPPPFDGALAAVFPRWWSRDTFNAVEDVSLNVPAGSALGIVGHNGAGKTTLLKIIAGVTSPTKGTVTTSGRIAALIDLLVGFHPDLTGRENVYLLGSAHGFGRRTMAPRVERILEFAEIDEMVDTPLKRYSAGMAARLGFATITALDVEILLVDEVLAVGDVAFQRKCIGWLDEYQANGGTLVFVSHNLALVRNMTDTVLWLDHGRVRGEGPTQEILAAYASAMEQRGGDPVTRKRKHARKLMTTHGLDRWGAGGARVEEVHVEQPPNNGHAVEVSIRYEASDMNRGIFCIGFIDEAGQEIGAAASPLVRLDEEGGDLRCLIDPLPFWSGIYFPVVAIMSPDGVVRDRWKLDRAVVVDRNGEGRLAETFGPVDIHASWSGESS